MGGYGVVTKGCDREQGELPVQSPGIGEEYGDLAAAAEDGAPGRERGREASREKQSGPQAPRHLFEALDLTRPAQVCPWNISASSHLLSTLFSQQVVSDS